MSERLTIRRPDDFHLHLRDGDMMRAVLPFTAEVFARAIVMPNLVPPVRTTNDVIAYRDRILACLAPDHEFEPLMTAYLTDDTDAADIEAGAADGVIKAVKLYPAGATTNSDSGVTSVARVERVLETMERIGLPLLLHGEVADPEIDIFDREAVYIERVLDPLRRQFPALRVVLEHVTTEDAVAYVRSADAGVAATITPHHLMINRNAIFRGGINPHMFCLPVAKRERHRQALREAATSGDSRFFLGTDSAPHPRRDKETDCGCAGIFNAPTAISSVVQVFEEEGALDRVEAFTSANGAKFYQLPENSDHIVVQKNVTSETAPLSVPVGDDQVRVFSAGGTSTWDIVAESRRVTPKARPSMA
jgi:dihydroorotase